MIAAKKRDNGSWHLENWIPLATRCLPYSLFFFKKNVLAFHRIRIISTNWTGSIRIATICLCWNCSHNEQLHTTTGAGDFNKNGNVSIQSSITSQKALGQICSCFSDILYHLPQEYIYDDAIGVLVPSLSLSLPSSHISIFSLPSLPPPSPSPFPSLSVISSFTPLHTHAPNICTINSYTPEIKSFPS